MHLRLQKKKAVLSRSAPLSSLSLANMRIVENNAAMACFTHADNLPQFIKLRENSIVDGVHIYIYIFFFLYFAIQQLFVEKYMFGENEYLHYHRLKKTLSAGSKTVNNF